MKPFLFFSCFFAGVASAAEPRASAAGVVSNVLVTSDHVEDVSSIEAWKRSTIKPGMTDDQKAVALFESIVRFGHFDPPPVEFAGIDQPTVHDAIKLFNVYGYGSDPTSLAMTELARSLGMNARAWSVSRWGCVPEIEYDQAWHALDPTMICYYRNPQGGIASVAELRAGVKAWYEQNPGYLGNVDKLKAFQANPGIAKGPEILSKGQTTDAGGNFPLNYFGWFSSMVLYDGTTEPFVYEEPYTEGYRVNVQLRTGEKLVRSWSNAGKHVNMDGSGGAPEVLNATVGAGPLFYTPKYGDLANGRVGSGTLDYQMPMTQADFTAAVLAADNAVCEKRIHAKDPAKPAVFVVRMPCSYVYLGGALSYDAVIEQGGSIAVAFSDDNGLDWRDLATATAAGTQTVDLGVALRRYDYRLRFTLTGAKTAIGALSIHHDLQCSQRALPALAQGANTIAFAAGPDEGTISIEPGGVKCKGKGPTFDDFHAVLEHISREKLESWGPMLIEGGAGSVTYPVETPGDLVRLRFGCNYRAYDAADGWDLQVSFDDGKSFKTVDRAAGPTAQNGKFVTCADIPPRTRKALVRFAGTMRNTTVIFRSRIDADYAEPHGGFAPVKVTYTWEEAGQAKQDVHIATSAKDSWRITCASKPKMGSIILERAP